MKRDSSIEILTKTMATACQQLTKKTTAAWEQLEKVEMLIDIMRLAHKGEKENDNSTADNQSSESRRGSPNGI